MRSKFCLSNYQKIHFIGIGGVSMSGLAKYVLDKNVAVSGSDLLKNEVTDELKALGADVYNGHSSQNIKGADAVVVTSAISADNPELAAAKASGVPLFERSEMLGDILSLYRNSVAVAGCHGKTTATAMISEVLTEGGKDPTVFLGGDCQRVNRFRAGSSDVAVAEACEYKKNLLNVLPRIAVVLNLDNDHMDTYKNMAEMAETFKQFTQNSLAVLNADDLYSDKLFNSATVTFGIDRPATYTAKSVKYNGKGYSFTLCRHYRPLLKINLKVFGWHNVYNALAACAVGDILGVSPIVIKRALEGFMGVKRRNEYLGEREGVKFFADYAHHPKEIAATLDGYSQSGEKFLTVFQPHTYSRTKYLMQDFISVLKNQDGLIIYDTYAAREDYDQAGSAEQLFYNLKKSGCVCEFVSDKQKLYDSLDAAKKDFGKMLFLGAGDIYDIATEYVLKR